MDSVEHSPSGLGVFRGDEHQPPAIFEFVTQNPFPILTSLDRACSRFSGTTYQSYCPFFQTFSEMQWHFLLSVFAKL